MNKLTKKYKVVHEGTKMAFPLTEEGDNAEVFPAVNATAVEFDTYPEAKAYVDEHNQVKEVPKFEQINKIEGKTITYPLLLYISAKKTQRSLAFGMNWNKIQP